MSIVAYAWGYLAALLAVGVLDGLWLGVIARSFYQAEMAPVAAENFKLIPAALFYVLYPVGVLSLALTPAVSGWTEALGRSALLGLVVYGVYDLTNMATLKTWSLKLALVDATWGAFVTGMAGVIAYTAMQWATSSATK
ncbi:DUF2177 family protein [Hydrogenophaga sp. PAMC20947]|uniref:DUF2177 family protein n=1 Tax=Hydrogenophaga sp. PAMC20947 TaxID=2565558 RepID=UPI00109DFE9C|nr:DUF2177 family protein [Hydrogenophaga sp. PAMC20947]QCB47098.1 DUF2177 family protein [Hydrogenophaga sp. PAMC20947]